MRKLHSTEIRTLRLCAVRPHDRITCMQTCGRYLTVRVLQILQQEEEEADYVGSGMEPTGTQIRRELSEMLTFEVEVDRLRIDLGRLWIEFIENNLRSSNAKTENAINRTLWRNIMFVLRRTGKPG